MLLLEDRNDDVAVYRIEDGRDVGINRYIATTPHTRAICNDPTVCGVDYTRRLQRACTSVLELYRRFASVPLECRETVVLNILRGGLNFGLREALADACGWNTMGTSFISAQRVRDAEDSEDWHITESDYRKVYLPERAQIVFGDVVATGTSLHHALKLIVRSAEETGAQITRFVFFTYGGVRAEEILSDIAALCRERFDSFTGVDLFYLEGRFTVPTPATPLTIKLTGTDLVRYGALMAPEFMDSQYGSPLYPLERCIIYDAGSRAFHPAEYVADVEEYWRTVLKQAQQGRSFRSILAERFPEIDAARFGKVDLREIVLSHLMEIEKILG